MAGSASQLLRRLGGVPYEKPVHGRTTGLRELGLPNAVDPAITRPLASFLMQAAVAMNDSFASHRMARPSAVLFNGGFCAPAVTKGLSMQLPQGLMAIKAADGPSYSTIKRSRVRLLGVPLATAAYGTAPACASAPATRAPAISDCYRIYRIITRRSRSARLLIAAAMRFRNREYRK
jgi:hypothetical protein